MLPKVEGEVAFETDGKHWLIETKGQEDVNVTLKDRAAELWCRNATELGVGDWRYVKVRQKDFEASEPRGLVELERLGQGRMGGVSRARFERRHNRRRSQAVNATPRRAQTARGRRRWVMARSALTAEEKAEAGANTSRKVPTSLRADRRSSAP